MNKKVRIISWAIIGSFLLGFVGFLRAYYSGNYRVDGADSFFPGTDPFFYSIEHAAFDSFGQFFFNRDKGGHLNWMVTITQFTSPILMIGGVMTLVIYFQTIVDHVRSWICKIRGGKVVAIYGDSEESRRITRADDKKNREQAVVYRAEELFSNAHEHVIFFGDDRKSLEFFENNQKKLCRKKVHLVFDETDPFLFEKKGNISKANIVNINELIAKKFWKENDLIHFRRDGKVRADIAIVGFGELGKKLLHYGIILNCYDTEQSIRYHVWGDTKLYRASIPADRNISDISDCINDKDMHDEVHYEDGDIADGLEKLYQMDRIILADGCDAELVQTVIRGCPTETEIFFIDPEGTSMGEYYRSTVRSYGERDSYDVDEIIRDAEHEAAKDLNAEYTRNHGTEDEKKISPEELWDDLDPFTKESNDITADYNVIREKILADSFLRRNADGSSEDITVWREHQINEMTYLEHVRWCRFHYMNGWKTTARGSDGKRMKDKARRLHSDLINFADLPVEQQTKDHESIACMLRNSKIRSDTKAFANAWIDRFYEIPETDENEKLKTCFMDNFDAECDEIIKAINDAL